MFAFAKNEKCEENDFDLSLLDNLVNNFISMWVVNTISRLGKMGVDKIVFVHIMNKIM